MFLGQLPTTSVSEIGSF